MRLERSHCGWICALNKLPLLLILLLLSGICQAGPWVVEAYSDYERKKNLPDSCQVGPWVVDAHSNYKRKMIMPDSYQTVYTKFIFHGEKERLYVDWTHYLQQYPTSGQIALSAATLVYSFPCWSWRPYLRVSRATVGPYLLLKRSHSFSLVDGETSLYLRASAHTTLWLCV